MVKLIIVFLLHFTNKELIKKLSLKKCKSPNSKDLLVGEGRRACEGENEYRGFRIYLGICNYLLF